MIDDCDIDFDRDLEEEDVSKAPLLFDYTEIEDSRRVRQTVTLETTDSNMKAILGYAREIGAKVETLGPVLL